MFIFCRLKINHDSHEFVLESGTVANDELSLYYTTVNFLENCNHLGEFINILGGVLGNWVELFYEKKTETEILAGLPPFKDPGVLCVIPSPFLFERPLW